MWLRVRGESSFLFQILNSKFSVAVDVMGKLSFCKNLLVTIRFWARLWFPVRPGVHKLMNSKNCFGPVRLAALRMIACKRSLAGVHADMPIKLIFCYKPLATARFRASVWFLPSVRPFMHSKLRICFMLFTALWIIATVSSFVGIRECVSRPFWCPGIRE